MHFQRMSRLSMPTFPRSCLLTDHTPALALSMLCLNFVVEYCLFPTRNPSELGRKIELALPLLVIVNVLLFVDSLCKDRLKDIVGSCHRLCSPHSISASGYCIISNYFGGSGTLCLSDRRSIETSRHITLDFESSRFGCQYRLSTKSNLSLYKNGCNVLYLILGISPGQ